jgi:hypothetical protein
VTLQVLPFEAGAYQGMTGAFLIMHVGVHGAFPIVAVDSLTQISYREEQDEISQYAHTFNQLRATALSKSDSRALIQRLLSDA